MKINIYYICITIFLILIILYCIYFNGVHKLKDEIIDLNNDIISLRKEILYLKSFQSNQNLKISKFSNYKSLTSKRILVTGGAGFIGSHLIDYLMSEGNYVIAIDNLVTGRRSNIERWIGHPNFEFIHHDTINPIWLEVDQVYHLASPASPQDYMKNSIKTIKTNTLGTINMLGLAKRNNATFLLASTSEVYGDPEEHPQKESYFGNVNIFGPRACYDESKRLAETISYAYLKQGSVSIRIARIFNTYGPRMRQNDGRVISNFIYQSLTNKSLTIYGNGSQTRSFQYVTDLVEGLRVLMNSNLTSPVNLGNPDEHTIFELSKIVLKLVPGSSSDVVYRSSQQDDPRRRLPDISKAIRHLNWKPRVSLLYGLRRTLEYMKREIDFTVK